MLNDGDMFYALCTINYVKDQFFLHAEKEFDDDSYWFVWKIQKNEYWKVFLCIDNINNVRY